MVELTKHTPTEAHILAAFPTDSAKLPCLSARVVITRPFISGVSNTGWRKSRIALCGESHDELACVHIMDYVEYLVLGGMSTRPNNLKYFNFSNEFVQNSSTEFFDRRPAAKYDDHKDIWMSEIMIESIWIDSPCDKTECDPLLPDFGCDDTLDCSTNDC